MPSASYIRYQNILKLQGKSSLENSTSTTFDELSRSQAAIALQRLDLKEKPSKMVSAGFKNSQSSRQSPTARRISFQNLSNWHQKELLKLNTIASTMQPDLAKLKQRLFTKSTAATQEPVLLTEGFVTKLKKVVAEHTAPKLAPLSIWGR